MSSVPTPESVPRVPSPPPDKGTPSGDAPRSALQVLLFDLTRNKRTRTTVLVLILVVVAAVAAILWFTDITWSGAVAWIEGLSPLAVLPLMAILPIFGFPISVVYVIAGARFGLIGGSVVVAAVTAVHLVGTHLVARSFLREPLRRYIERRHAKLPAIPVDEQAAVGVVAALVPGPPYVVRNYVLALAGVKLRYLLLACLPVYVVRSCVSLLIGDFSSDPTGTRIAIVIAADLLQLAVCVEIIRRLRRHHRRVHGSGNASDPASR
jgi:uncharacterized membrane protein YdjX (TVP38/TMEM64 family)